MRPSFFKNKLHYLKKLPYLYKMDKQYNIIGDIEKVRTVQVGGIYTQTRFTIIEKVKEEWVFCKFVTDIIKITKVYPGVWSLTNTEWNYDLLDTYLL